MKQRRAVPAVLFAIALVVAAVTGTAQSASANNHRHLTKASHPAPLATGHQRASSKLPVLPHGVVNKYQIVSSALLTDTANTQVSGTASCPAGNTAVGGGAVISSSSLAENLNGSNPISQTTWQVFVNNSSSTSGTFRVYAVCVKKIAKYSLVTGTGVSNPSGAQTSAVAVCPTKTVPIGGGGLGSSTATSVNLNTTIPLSNGWRVDVNNASAGADTVTAVVICGKAPTGYTQVSAGTATTVNSGTQASSTASCPSGTVVLSGGGFSSSGSTSVNVNSTAPSSSSTWTTYENNSSTGAVAETAYAVCATPKS